MNDDIRTALRKGAEAVSLMGDPSSAYRSGRRRRAVSLATPIVVALAGVGLVVAVSQVQPSSSPSPAEPPPSQDPVVGPDVEALVPLTDWIPATSELGRPAPVGTALYRTCQDSHCTVFLLRADGKSTKLADVQPVLAKQMESLPDLTGVSLSFDGRWIGIPIDGGGYGIQSFTDASLGTELAPTAEDRAWEMVGWGSGSFNASLVERDGDQAARYALVDVARGLEVHDYDAEALGNLAPTAHTGEGVYVAEPVSSSSSAASWPPITALGANQLQLQPLARPGVGTITPLGRPVDASSSLGEAETLAGPDGVPQSVLAPVSPGEDYAFPIAGIYDVSQGEPVLAGAAIVKSIDGGSSVRFEVPESTADSAWEILNPLTAESLAMLQRTPTATRVVSIDITGSRTVMHDELPADAEVLVPGDRWGEF